MTKTDSSASDHVTILIKIITCLNKLNYTYLNEFSPAHLSDYSRQVNESEIGLNHAILGDKYIATWKCVVSSPKI